MGTQSTQTDGMTKGMNRLSLRIACLTALWLGAMVSPAAAQSPLPDGEGKAQLQQVCTVCHTLDNVTKTRRSRDEWMADIDDMQTRGADGSEQDFMAILDYLSKNFGPQPASSENPNNVPPASAGSPSPPPAPQQKPKEVTDAPTKINVNQATVSELMSQLQISQESASAIVQYRATQGGIKNWESLKKVPGLDLQQLEEYKDRLEF
jgi:competence ComEA-like helix-hairpin-helix protein